MKTKKIPLIGLYQAIGVAIYTGLVATFMWNMEKLSIQPEGGLGIMMMLFLLVFSAAITGLIVFGYPVYLALNHKTKEALALLGHTFLYFLILFIIILLIILM